MHLSKQNLTSKKRFYLFDPKNNVNAILNVQALDRSCSKVQFRVTSSQYTRADLMRPAVDLFKI